jgi:diguanylate cyclase (GGDEF)-like protein
MAGEEEAAAVAERIRQSVGEVAVPCGRDSIPVTLSAGVAAWPQNAAESELQLVDLADAALYLAKRGGRNRVVSRASVVEGSAARPAREESVMGRS